MIPGRSPHAAGAALPVWRRHSGLTVLGGMGAMALLLFVLSVFGDQGIFRIGRLTRDRALLEEKVAAAERDTEALRRRLEDLRQGRGSSELAAREKLGLVKPGEVVYDFRPDPLRQDAAGTAGAVGGR
jgi:cell division protein FtsB